MAEESLFPESLTFCEFNAYEKILAKKRKGFRPDFNVLTPAISDKGTFVQGVLDNF